MIGGSGLRGRASGKGRVGRWRGGVCITGIATVHLELELLK